MTTRPDPAILSTFTGYAGLDLAVQQILGGHVIAHADNDPAATAVLAHHWPQTPNLGDLTTIDWHSLAASTPVDVVTGGFPCQDVSAAGSRAGLAPGTRSGLWAHMASGIAVLRPRLVVIENVRGLLSAPAHRDLEPDHEPLGNRPGRPVLRALGAVLGDLATLGYDARWHGLRAADIGAPHGRFRVFIVATDTTSHRRHQRRTEPAGQQRGSDAALRSAAAANPHSTAREQRGKPTPGQTQAGRARADTRGRGGTPAAHPDSEGPQGAEPAPRPNLLARSAPADPESLRCPPGNLGSRDSTQRPVPDSNHVPAWGRYEPAIRRWEHLLGRAAPEPTEPGRAGNPVLSPTFVEWLMGLPAGHVTDIPGLTRNAQLRLLGNGVVPQQAAAALSGLLPGVGAFDDEVAA